MKAGVPERIRAAGGEIYAITSEPQQLADRAAEDWRTGMEHVGDPHHEILVTCRERGWLDLFVQDKLEFLSLNAESPQHPKGYFQPGVLALTREGRVLYRWRSIPSRKNIGGAVARPTAEHVWSSVSCALADGTDADAALDEKPPLDARGIPWSLFVTLLIANGWFVRSKAFRQLPNGPSAQARIAVAALRALVFVAAWVVAFRLLPTLWVGVALALWVAWIVPHVRFVNSEFQNATVTGDE